MGTHRWLPWYPDTCVWLDNNQPAGWDVVTSLSLSLSGLDVGPSAQQQKRGATDQDQPSLAGVQPAG